MSKWEARGGDTGSFLRRWHSIIPVRGVECSLPGQELLDQGSGRTPKRSQSRTAAEQTGPLSLFLYLRADVPEEHDFPAAAGLGGAVQVNVKEERRDEPTSGNPRPEQTTAQSSSSGAVESVTASTRFDARFVDPTRRLVWRGSAVASELYSSLIHGVMAEQDYYAILDDCLRNQQQRPFTARQRQGGDGDDKAFKTNSQDSTGRSGVKTEGDTSSTVSGMQSGRQSRATRGAAHSAAFEVHPAPLRPDTTVARIEVRLNLRGVDAKLKVAVFHCTLEHQEGSHPLGARPSSMLQSSVSLNPPRPGGSGAPSELLAIFEDLCTDTNSAAEAMSLCDAMQAEVRQARALHADAVRAKAETESRLLEGFAAILNEKKKKIQELQEDQEILRQQLEELEAEAINRPKRTRELVAGDEDDGVNYISSGATTPRAAEEHLPQQRQRQESGVVKAEPSDEGITTNSLQPPPVARADTLQPQSEGQPLGMWNDESRLSFGGRRDSSRLGGRNTTNNDDALRGNAGSLAGFSEGDELGSRQSTVTGIPKRNSLDDLLDL